MSISKPALDLSPALLFHPGEDWSEQWEIKVNWFKRQHKHGRGVRNAEASRGSLPWHEHNVTFQSNKRT